MDNIKAIALWIAYRLQFWWLKRQIKLVAYRRGELAKIIEREYAFLDHEEHRFNVRLRELQHAQLNAQLVKAPT